jgi:hypothetical protein
VAGLDPTLKADRLANYLVNLRHELVRLSRACGVPHPSLVTSDHFEILDGQFRSSTLEELFGYEPGMGLPGERDRQVIAELMLPSG